MSESIIQCCFRISCEISVDCGHYCHGDRCVTRELLICRKNDVLMLFPGLCLAFVTGGLQSRVLARECIPVTLVFSQCLCSQELMNRHGATSEPLLPHLLLGKINPLGGYLYLIVMWPSCDHHVPVMWLSCDCHVMVWLVLSSHSYYPCSQPITESWCVREWETKLINVCVFMHQKHSSTSVRLHFIFFDVWISRDLKTC